MKYTSIKGMSDIMPSAMSVWHKLEKSALKIFGAYGYSTEFPVERYYRDAKAYQIVEGSVNIQKLIIAQDALGYRNANR